MTSLWTIGELAKKTGLTVRTLHHYEEIGLLVPSHRGENNYRQYDATDIERLQRIVSLKQLGFSLEQIKNSLDTPGFSLADVTHLHLEKMRLQFKHQEQLLERLEGLERFAKSGTPEPLEMLEAIDLLNKIEANYTEEELEELRGRAKQLGKEGMIAAEQEWPQLIKDMQGHMERNTDPGNPDVQRIAKRWKELVEAFTGGNPQIAAKVKKMYEDNPHAAQRFGGPSPELMAYVQRAMEAGGISL